MVDEVKSEQEVGTLPPLGGNVNTSAPLSKTYAGYDPDQIIAGAYDMLSKSLDSRTQKPQQMFDPTLMAMAQGFLAPTKTGSFGESLGYASGKVGEAEAQKQSQWEAEQKRIQDNAMMRLSLGKESKAALNEQNTQALMGQLYKQDENGMWVLNPQVAQQLASLTKKPEYAAMVVEDQKKRTFKEIGNQLFKINETTQKYDFDPSALNQLIKLSDDPAADLGKYAKLIPEMRKAGMINGLDGDATPFDALIAAPDIPTVYKEQAKLLANQVKRGVLDPEKADAMAKDILQLSMSHLDKVEQRNLLKAQHAVTNLLATQGRDLQRDKFEETKKLNEGKLNDTQKMQYKTVVLPAIQEGVKATSLLSDVEALKGYVARAPSGLPSSAISGTIGRLVNSDQNTAMREIEASQKKMLANIPRLPGSASNFDAKNLEASIGKLSDWTLDTKARIKLVADIEDGFKKLQSRAQMADDFWESNKQIHPELLGKKEGASTNTTRTVVKTGVVTSGPNKGKKAILYSDGTQEIQ
jgi:hypothetical protein